MLMANWQMRISLNISCNFVFIDNIKKVHESYDAFKVLKQQTETLRFQILELLHFSRLSFVTQIDARKIIWQITIENKISGLIKQCDEKLDQSSHS